MAKKAKIRDTDYLFLSAYVHARETKLAGRERLERMVDARTADEAEKLLEECGWPPFDPGDSAALEHTLAARRNEIFHDMRSLAPNSDIVDVFRVQYDYHNVKTLIKAEATGRQAEPLLLGSGRVEPDVLQSAVLAGEFGKLPDALASAYVEAKDVLARTGDPQRADFLLDRAYFREMAQLAERTGSAFLCSYVRLLIDAANLRAIVRARRTGKNRAFVRDVLSEGGSVSREAVLNLWEQGEMLTPYASGALREAAEAAEAVLDGGRLTAFEKLCDDALAAYMAQARRAGLNEQPLIGYLYAVESEISAVRVILSGKLAGLPAQAIKERLREGV